MKTRSLAMRPALIIFDCDGVLIDSEVLSARALIDELACHGVAVDMGFVARHFIGRAYPVIVAEVSARFGVTLPDDFEERYRGRLLASFRTDLAAMAGAMETVEALQVPACVATSSSPARLAASLAMVGLDRHFDGRTFTASEVPHGKPAPDLFLHAAAVMGADPSTCVVVEDSVPGLLAGLAAGMQVWRFTGGSHLANMDVPLPVDCRPHRSFASFAELRAALPHLFHPSAGVVNPA